MGKKLNRQQQHAVLQAMLDEARAAQHLPLAEIVQAVKRTRDDLVRAAQAGIDLAREEKPHGPAH